MVHTLFNETLSSGTKFGNRRNMGLYIGNNLREEIMNRFELRREAMIVVGERGRICRATIL